MWRKNCRRTDASLLLENSSDGVGSAQGEMMGITPRRLRSGRVSIMDLMISASNTDGTVGFWTQVLWSKGEEFNVSENKCAIPISDNDSEKRRATAAVR